MRVSKDEFFLSLAEDLSGQSTCRRRSVGCVLVNSRYHIIGTGYNGRPAGYAHCVERESCAGLDSASGTNLELCEAIHAEANALLQCTVPYEIETCYVTASPCFECTKLLANTSCRHVIFRDRYAHNERAKEFFMRVNARQLGRTWEWYEHV